MYQETLNGPVNFWTYIFGPANIEKHFPKDLHVGFPIRSHRRSPFNELYSDTVTTTQKFDTNQRQ